MSKSTLQKTSLFNITDRVYEATSEDFDIISTTAIYTGCWNAIMLTDTTVFNSGTASIIVTDYTKNIPTPTLTSQADHYLNEARTGIDLSVLNGILPAGCILPKMYFTQLQIASGVLIAFK